MVITENNVGGSQESVSTVWNSQEYNLLSVSMGLTSWPNQPGMQRIQEKKCVCIEVQMLDIYKELRSIFMEFKPNWCCKQSRDGLKYSPQEGMYKNYR